MKPRRANLVLLLAGAVWGMGFVAQETAMVDMGPFLFTGLRFILAGVVVLPLAWRERRMARNKLSPANIKMLMSMGVVFFFGLVLQQIGLLTTSVTNAGFLTALYVIFVPMILLLVLSEKQPAIIWPAALVALSGVFLLSGGQLSALVIGDWLVIAGAMFGAIHVILVGKLSKESASPFTIAASQFVISGTLGIIGYFIAPIFAVPEPSASWQMVLAAGPEILYAGIFSGALAFSLMAIGQQYTGTAAAAILLSSESLFAALFAAFLLGERLPALGYLGCGLIFSALLLVEFKPGKYRRGTVG